MALHFVSYGFCGVVNFALLETSAENFEKLRSRTAAFTSTDIQLRTHFVLFVTSLPWTHGLRTD